MTNKIFLSKKKYNYFKYQIIFIKSYNILASFENNINKII